MPRVFRIMKKDAQGKPVIGQTATSLGIRLRDIDMDVDGKVICNDKGMSVRPVWQDSPLRLIPKRLGGRGGDNTHCFRRGDGPFVQSACGEGLELFPDSPTHGVVRPVQTILLASYEAHLHATQQEWEIDET